MIAILWIQLFSQFSIYCIYLLIYPLSVRILQKRILKSFLQQSHSFAPFPDVSPPVTSPIVRHYEVNSYCSWGFLGDGWSAQLFIVIFCSWNSITFEHFLDLLCKGYYVTPLVSDESLLWQTYAHHSAGSDSMQEVSGSLSHIFLTALVSRHPVFSAVMLNFCQLQDSEVAFITSCLSIQWPRSCIAREEEELHVAVLVKEWVTANYLEGRQTMQEIREDTHWHDH